MVWLKMSTFINANTERKSHGVPSKHFFQAHKCRNVKLITRIHVSYVFVKKHRKVERLHLFMSQLYVASGSISISCRCVYALVRFRHKNHLVRVRRTSWFGLKYLLWSPQTHLEILLMSPLTHPVLLL